MYTVKTSQNLNELPDAKAIRQEVFVTEQGFTEEFDSIDNRAYHIVIYDNGIPIATGRTFAEGDSYIIGRVAVIKPYRGKHIGGLVMSELEKLILSLGIKKVSLSAQVRAKGFYDSIGYQAYGEEYLDEYCPHIKMIKELK